jgi:23S rRNA pseudouridine2605 synthase
MTDESATLRVNKHLALQLGISRREADDIIAKGKVTVNGAIATLGARFKEGDDIKIQGEDVAADTAYQYLILNKPVGYVCSRRQQGDNPTIYELLPEQYHHLKPVGRLDKDSSGVILLSNDGNFAFTMTHPKFNKTKIYEVELTTELAPLHQQMISDHGIQLEDGTSTLQLERANETDRKNWIVTMHEGRNRQIRRTFNALGYTVEKLHRTNFGNYSLGDIQPGKFEITNIL